MSDILNAERLRLRAERAEKLARAWRNTALFLLVLLIAQTWLVVDTAMSLSSVRREARNAADAAVEYRMAYTNAARKFETCKIANAGLVDGLREQQALLNEAIDLAKRCEARDTVQWRTDGEGTGEFFAAQIFASEAAP